MNWNPYRLIAHRGLHDNENGVPENSMPAFQRAIEECKGIELDIRLTADGEAIVFHDNNTRRMTGRDIETRHAAWEELSALRLLGTSCGIPRFAQVLELVNGRVPLVVELKCGSFPGELPRKVCDLLAGYRGEYVIESFNPLAVLWYKKNAPEIPRGILGGAETNSGLFSSLIFKPWALKHVLDPHFVAYDIDSLTPAQSEAWRGQGRGVLCWTVSTPAQLEKAQRLCDGIIYERISP